MTILSLDTKCTRFFDGHQQLLVQNIESGIRREVQSIETSVGSVCKQKRSMGHHQVGRNKPWERQLFAPFFNAELSGSIGSP